MHFGARQLGKTTGKLLDQKIEGWRFGQATVLCKGNLEEADGIRYIPWYMVLFLRPQPLPETMIVEVDLSAL